MSKSINFGSEFISITQPEDKPWLRNIYWGLRDGTGKHGHLALSGSLSLSEIWYVRDLNNNEIIKNGSSLTNNTSQLLLNCIPTTLKEFHYPEQPLFWNVGSLDSLFLSQKKFSQQQLLKTK